MNLPPPLVCSVCIANYNGESLLINCIDSFLNQDCGFPIEIIVHDDASTDKSLELLACHYPQIIVIASKTNVGFCVSNNRMVEAARGQFILLLNNDAALAPDALKSLHRHAELQPSPGILTLPQYDWESGDLVDRGCLLDPFYNPVPNLNPSVTNVAMVIGACLWIPRSLWFALGGFPEWFESIAEDMQLCCRARLAGFPVEAAKDSGYRHMQGKTFGGNRVQNRKLNTTYTRRCLSERNKIFVMATCTPTPYLWLLLPIHIILIMTEGIMLSIIKGDFKIWWKIYAQLPRSIIENKEKIQSERKSVRQTRKISIKTYLSVFKKYPQKLRLLFSHGIPQVT